MSLTLEVTPAVEQALANKAQLRGVPLETYAVSVLEREAANEMSNGASGTVAEGAARQRLFGKYAGRTRAVEDFLREKHDEVELEEAARSRRTAVITQSNQEAKPDRGGTTT